MSTNSTPPPTEPTVQPVPQPRSSVNDTDTTAMKTLTEWEALKNFGYWQPIDSAFIILQVMVMVFMGAFEFFDTPVLMNYILAGIVMGIFQLIWVTILVYRVAHFVLSLHSTVNLMPEESARMAAAYLSGKMGRSPM